jgi:hypothetical protein
VIEVERTVNASGHVSLGNHMISAGLPLAVQRVTLRLVGPVAHILSGGILTRTIARPVPGQARARLRGGRAGTAQPPRLPDPLTVTRRVSARGAIMISGAEDPGRPGPRPQDRPGHRGIRHLPDHRRPRDHHHRAPYYQPDIKRHKASNYQPG